MNARKPNFGIAEVLGTLAVSILLITLAALAMAW